MRIRVLLAVGLASILAAAAAACGSDAKGGPPGGGGSGGNDDSGLEEQPAPEPGICRRLCCSSGDCSTGESCTAFNTAWGSLGTCSGSGWGVDAGGGMGGTTSDGGATPPPGCWNLEAFCNPITNEVCPPGDACDYQAQEDPEFQPVVDCLGGDSTQGPGEDCDNVEGPFCIPGFHCVPK